MQINAMNDVGAKQIFFRDIFFCRKSREEKNRVDAIADFEAHHCVVHC